MADGDVEYSRREQVRVIERINSKDLNDAKAKFRKRRIKRVRWGYSSLDPFESRFDVVGFVKGPRVSKGKFGL